MTALYSTTRRFCKQLRADRPTDGLSERQVRAPADAGVFVVSHGRGWVGVQFRVEDRHDVAALGGYFGDEPRVDRLVGQFPLDRVFVYVAADGFQFGFQFQQAFVVRPGPADCPLPAF